MRCARQDEARTSAASTRYVTAGLGPRQHASSSPSARSARAPSKDESPCMLAQHRVDKHTHTHRVGSTPPVYNAPLMRTRPSGRHLARRHAREHVELSHRVVRVGRQRLEGGTQLVGGRVGGRAGAHSRTRHLARRLARARGHWRRVQREASGRAMLSLARRCVLLLVVVVVVVSIAGLVADAAQAGLLLDPGAAESASPRERGGRVSAGGEGAGLRGKNKKRGGARDATGARVGAGARRGRAPPVLAAMEMGGRRQERARAPRGAPRLQRGAGRAGSGNGWLCRRRATHRGLSRQFLHVPQSLAVQPRQVPHRCNVGLLERPRCAASSRVRSPGLFGGISRPCAWLSEEGRGRRA